jgi:two-component system, response regulator PdtaR
VLVGPSCKVKAYQAHSNLIGRRKTARLFLPPADRVLEAACLLRQEHPQAAVLDVNLAGERVTPVAEVLRAMTIPFVLASGYGAAELKEEEVLREAVNVGKPTPSERLLLELRQMVRPGVAD